MPEVEMVEGTEITPEEARGPGWNAAISKKRKPRSELQVSDNVAHAGAGTRVSRRTSDPRGAMKRLATASRLPRLPREHVRIIVRPRDGLDVRKVNHYAIMQAFVRAAGIAPEAAKADIICPNVVQNILVIATPSEKNAEAYSKLQRIQLESKSYAVAPYIAAPDNTSKGVVRGIDASLSDTQLQELFVNERNPTILEVKRIKTSQTVVLLFDGMRVPRHVMFGIYMVRCSLFKRQNDVCYTCGQPGHRADVCVNPKTDACKKCGLKSPSDDHPCTPKCAMCAGAHPTGSKTCKQRFQVPYVVRQRRRQRSRSRRRQQLGGQSRHPSRDVTWRDRSSTPAGQRRSALRRERSPSPGSRGRSVSKGRSHSRHRRAQSRRRFQAGRRSESRGTSGQQDLQTSSSWADKVKEGTTQNTTQVTTGPLPEHVNDPRVDKLVAENRQMSQKLNHVTHRLEQLMQTFAQVQEENARLKAENEALRAEKVSPPTSSQVEVSAKVAKRKASTPHDTPKSTIEETLTTLTVTIKTMSDDMAMIFQRLSAAESTLAAYSQRTAALESAKLPLRPSSPMSLSTEEPSGRAHERTGVTEVTDHSYHHASRH